MLTTIKNWYKKTASHCDPLELEQAITRLAIGTIFTIYLLCSFAINKEIISAYSLIFAYAILSTLLLIAVINNKYSHIFRRLVGAWIDISGASAFMALTSDVGVMLVAFDLWAIFGNGFRYGKKYLYHAQILSIIGFLIASNVSPYWLTHQTIGYSLLAMLIVLPLYVAKLIDRMHQATHKEEIERQKSNSSKPCQNTICCQYEP